MRRQGHDELHPAAAAQAAAAGPDRGHLLAAAFVGLSAAIAVRGSFWWPFAVMIGITLLGYLFGLSNYGVGAQDPADEEAGAEDSAPFPVSP